MPVREVKTSFFAPLITNQSANSNPMPPNPPTCVSDIFRQRLLTGNVIFSFLIEFCFHRINYLVKTK